MPNLDWTNSQEVFEYAMKTVDISEQCHQARLACHKAKFSLDVVIASKINELRQKRANIGYEMAMLTIISEVPELKKDYEMYTNEESNYKGLDKVIEARQNVVSLAQSLMKNREKDGG